MKRFPAAIALESASILRGVRLHALYDEAYLDTFTGWLRPQGLVARIVRRGDRPIGWYAYVLRPGRASRVLHLAAAEQDVDATLGDLVEHARASGSAALAGRLEPHLDGSLRHRAPAIGFMRVPMVHARNTDVLATLASSSALLTQLDGEWFSPTPSAGGTAVPTEDRSRDSKKRISATTRPSETISTASQ